MKITKDQIEGARIDALRIVEYIDQGGTDFIPASTRIARALLALADENAALKRDAEDAALLFGVGWQETLAAVTATDPAARNAEFCQSRITGLVAEKAELEAEIAKLRERLGALLDHYASLVNSGDCGFWNPEREPVVMDARAILAQPEPGQEGNSNAT